MADAIQQPLTDFDAWYSSLEHTVATTGFLNAWRMHFPEIVRAYHSADASHKVLGPSLYALMTKDPALQQHFDSLTGDAAEHLRGVLTGTASRLGRWDSQLHADFVEGVREVLHLRAEAFPEVLEGNGRPMQCVRNEAFQNWGRTVTNTPSLTCLPRTKTGVCHLVQWATAHNKTVRVSGYRHTWTDLYSADDQILISLLPLDVVQDLPATEPPIDPDDELQGIQIVGQIAEDGVTKALCKLGAATTNEQFRVWCLDQRGGNWNWTVPLNVIMVEITWGGSNAAICHGAGRRHRTLSDLVVEVEFVNAKGELQIVSDPVQLKAAAGCFGLLGIVTSLTLKLDPMSYAAMTPTKPRVALTIPPPKGFAVPAGIDMSGITEADLDKARADFVHHCENDYYAEWFWFPYQAHCWVNCWNNDGRREDAQVYPNEIMSWIEQVEEYLGQLANEYSFKCLSGRMQAELLAFGGMTALPENKTIVTPLIEALHFRRGIQNMRVLDTEFEIPIPPRVDDPTQPDWTVCQKAWWAVIANLYNRSDAPMRITLEMRIMSDSAITMAPEFGNRFGTCSIEVLTNLNVDPQDWLAFMQEIADAWDSYTDPTGNRLNVRPHWAKQWQGLTLRGLELNEYLRTVAYQDRIPEFKAGLQAVCQAGGYTLADVRRRFSNPLTNDILQEVFT